MQVARAAAAAFGHADRLAVFEDFAQLAARVRVLHDGSERDADRDVAAVGAVLEAAASGFAVFCAALGLVEDADERVDVLVAGEEHVAAAAAVPAVRPAARDELFAAERIGAAASASGDGVQDAGVDERTRFHGTIPPCWLVCGPAPGRKKAPARTSCGDRGKWRREAESNRSTGICSPLPSRLAITPVGVETRARLPNAPRECKDFFLSGEARARRARRALRSRRRRTRGSNGSGGPRPGSPPCRAFRPGAAATECPPARRGRAAGCGARARRPRGPR